MYRFMQTVNEKHGLNLKVCTPSMAVFVVLSCLVSFLHQPVSSSFMHDLISPDLQRTTQLVRHIASRLLVRALDDLSSPS